MADFQMTSSVSTSNTPPVWDFLTVVDPITGLVTVPMLSGTQEVEQAAAVASFQNYGTIPQLSTVGVPWSSLLLGEVSFATVDSYIKQSLINAGALQFIPKYANVNGLLKVSIQNIEGSL